MFFSRKKFPSSETLEQEEKQKVKLYSEFVETQNSDILTEYNSLYKIVNSPDFQQEKKRLTSLKFKGSKEYQSEKEFNKLSRKRAIKLFLEVENSSDLQNYLAFKKSAEFKDIENADKRKESEKLTSFYKFQQSKNYKTYALLKDSNTLKRYQQLKAEVESEDFVAFKQLCEDTQRWQKTDFFKQEQRFNELTASSAISHFVKYAETSYFDEQKKWSLSFEESFKARQLDTNKWVKSLFWAKEMGDNLYASEDEFQAFNGEKNIRVESDALKLITRKEVGQGKFWNSENGFITKPTEYTSAVLSSLNSFSSDEGLVKIKFKLSGNKFVNHSAWLSTQDNKQSILLYKAQNKHCTVGTLNKGKSGVSTSVESVKIVPFYKDYHIFTAEWNAKEIIWKVNDLEIHKTQNTIKNNPLQLIINSTVSDNKKSGDGEMTIDWIKSYVKNQSN